MKVGQNVKLIREISFPTKDSKGEPITGYLEKGSQGRVAGVIDAGSDTMILFQPEGVENVYAVSKSAVQKTK